MKNVVITGSRGFVGKNLVNDLKQTKDYEIFEINRSTENRNKINYLEKADFIIHLAGVNRPEKSRNFMKAM